MNLTAEPVRVIQIWFAADPKHRGLAPHYQQLNRKQLPARRVGAATVYSLIGGGSPMVAHMSGRLTATQVEPGGEYAAGHTSVELPHPSEDLFLYITDGAGQVEYNQQTLSLGQYDVILARAGAEPITISAQPGQALHYLSFYLPNFLN